MSRKKIDKNRKNKEKEKWGEKKKEDEEEGKKEFVLSQRSFAAESGYNKLSRLFFTPELKPRRNQRGREK